MTAANPLMGFDKNDIMRIAEVAVLAIVGLLMLFFVARPLVRGAVGGGLPAVRGGPGGAGGPTQLQTMPDGTIQTINAPDANYQLALPQSAAQTEMDARLQMAQIEGQVKVNSVKRVADFVQSHPDESVSILRNWLHEST